MVQAYHQLHSVTSSNTTIAPFSLKERVFVAAQASPLAEGKRGSATVEHHQALIETALFSVPPNREL
jgi:hypothetical protein